MTKLPRNLESKDLIKILDSLGYIQIHQKGSHIKLTKIINGSKQSITIPNHKPLKVGTLSSIINQICIQNKFEKSYLLILINKL